MESKTYEIKTIRDLIEAAEETEDMDGLLKDLEMCLRLYAELAKHPDIDKQEMLNSFSVFRWTDDGIRKGNITFRSEK